MKLLHQKKTNGLHPEKLRDTTKRNNYDSIESQTCNHDYYILLI